MMNEYKLMKWSNTMQTAPEYSRIIGGDGIVLQASNNLARRDGRRKCLYMEILKIQV